MTPNDIEILIHCYVSPTEHPRYHANHDVFNRLVTEGLMRVVNGKGTKGTGWRSFWKQLSWGQI